MREWLKSILAQNILFLACLSVAAVIISLAVVIWVVLRIDDKVDMTLNKFKFFQPIIIKALQVSERNTQKITLLESELNKIKAYQSQILDRLNELETKGSKQGGKAKAANLPPPQQPAPQNLMMREYFYPDDPEEP